MEMSRIRKPKNVTLAPETVARLRAWIERQPVKLTESAVIEAALLEFLDREEAGDE